MANTKITPHNPQKLAFSLLCVIIVIGLKNLNINDLRSEKETSMFIAVLVTLLLALAVKQLSYALMQGSIFEPMREYIRTKMRQEVWGFETLNELVTCKLCTTMEVSLWCIAIPAVVLGNHFGVASHFLGEASSFLLWSALILGGFLYGMAVSALALGFWNFLEYPAKRYEDTAFQLQEAQRTITELEHVLETLDNTTK